MSSDLLSQLDRYYSWIDESQDPIGPDEVAALFDSPVRELAIQVPVDTRRHWLVGVLAAAAVLVLVGGVGLLLRVSGTERPIGSSSSLTWSRVPYDEAVFGGEYEQAIASVTVGGSGLVAVGQADPYAAVWTSPDGTTWSRIPNDEDAFGGAVMNGVTVGGPGLVAVGRAEPNAAVWTSPDGITWSRVPNDVAVFGGVAGPISGGASMSSVTAGGPGLVAVGFDRSLEGGGVAAVWTSPDGLTWSRVLHEEAVFGGEDDGYYGQSMSSVTAGGPGLVAVGGDVDRAAVWTSPDGLTWSRVPHNEAVFGGEDALGMSSVIVGGPGLVAVGIAEQADATVWASAAAVWTSSDGISWSRVAQDEEIFGGASMNDVTVGGQGLVAVGDSGLADAGQAKVWTSPDGLTWSLAPHDEAVFGGRRGVTMRSVTIFGPGLVAVGSDGVHATSGPTDSNAAVWSATGRG